MHLEIIYFMVRIAGAVFVVAGCTGMGLWLGRGIRRRVDELNEVKKTAILLRGEIRYSLAPLPEAIGRIALKAKPPLTEYLQEIYQELSAMEGKSFSEIWTRNTENFLSGSYLKPEDLNIIIDLGTKLGYLDKEMQLGAIDLFLDQLGQIIDEQVRVMPAKQKIYNYLGVLCGALIVILLI